MMSRKLIGAMLWILAFAGGVGAQSQGTIDAGTTITVRTDGQINANSSDGRVFPGVVDQDVINRGGNVAIPKGSTVELLVQNNANNQVSLDLDSVTVKGQRYGVQGLDSVVDVNTEQADGLGVNNRTGRFVGGGAAIGAIIGAIAGGGKGAAIGGGVGAAAGAGTQVLTRGKSVSIPAESLVTFRLEQPLQTGVSDNGFSRNGQHYHPGYSMNSGNSAAYQDGLQTGRLDSDRNLNRNARTTRWPSGQQFRDYQAGYNNGYDETPSSVQQANANLRIGSDQNVRWQGPANSRVFLQVDNNSRQLFASAASGTRSATWMTPGHVYVFVLQDSNGNEVARDESDLRPQRSVRSR